MKNAPRSGVALHIAGLVLLALIAGCASKKQDAAFDPKLTAQVSATASEAAVSKPGTKVCRWVQVGISERDWLRGVVQQREEANAVRVRIEDPGKFTNTLNGTPLTRGALVLDKAADWTPCVF